MLAEPEHYKGIFYVRLSTLPKEQQAKIRESFYRDDIVKILKDNSLLNDCIIYTDYVRWHKQFNPSPKKETPAPRELVTSESISYS